MVIIFSDSFNRRPPESKPHILFCSVRWGRGDQELVYRYYLLATQYNTMRQYTFTTGLQKLHHWVRAGRKSIQPVKGLKTRYW